jgi:hypothetical protein
MVVVAGGRTKALLMDSMNRASGRIAQNKLLIKVCQLARKEKTTEIILAKNLGQAETEQLPEDGSEPSWHVTATAVAEKDSVRVKEHEAATEKYNNSVAALLVSFSGCQLFSTLAKTKREKLSKELAEIEADTYTKEELQKMVATTKSWWEAEEEEDIFDLSSDEEEEEDFVYSEEEDFVHSEEEDSEDSSFSD